VVPTHRLDTLDHVKTAGSATNTNARKEAKDKDKKKEKPPQSDKKSTGPKKSEYARASTLAELTLHENAGRKSASIIPVNIKAFYGTLHPFVCFVITYSYLRYFSFHVLVYI